MVFLSVCIFKPYGNAQQSGNELERVNRMKRLKNDRIEKWKEEGIEGPREGIPENGKKGLLEPGRVQWAENYEEPEEPRSQCSQRANKPIVRPSDNWIKLIIEFLGSKMGNSVSLDWSQRGIATFLKFYKGNSKKLNCPNFS